MTLDELEQALDGGNLWVQATATRYWKVRRNGVTKRWKRDLYRYSIPCKAGFRDTFSLTNETVDRHSLIVSETDPNVKG